MLCTGSGGYTLPLGACAGAGGYSAPGGGARHAAETRKNPQPPPGLEVEAPLHPWITAPSHEHLTAARVVKQCTCGRTRAFQEAGKGRRMETGGMPHADAPPAGRPCRQETATGVVRPPPTNGVAIRPWELRAGDSSRGPSPARWGTSPASQMCRCSRQAHLPRRCACVFACRQGHLNADQPTSLTHRCWRARRA